MMMYVHVQTVGGMCDHYMVCDQEDGCVTRRMVVCVTSMMGV